MNAKTLQAIQRHGEILLLAFPNAIEKDPVALCKKLRRIETVAHKAATDYCNGEITSREMDVAEASCLRRVRVLLHISSVKAQEIGLFVNTDARGYALKLDSDWTRAYNGKQYGTERGRPIYTDMGSFGILAPDLNQ